MDKRSWYRQQPGGVALLAREANNHATLLFGVDVLLRDLVLGANKRGGGEHKQPMTTPRDERHLTLAPLDGFSRKLVHTMVDTTLAVDPIELVWQKTLVWSSFSHIEA
jgi:hypothetical protein